MLGGDLGEMSGFVPGGIAGEKGWILHAAHLGVGFGVDDGDDLVRVGAVTLIELGKGFLNDVEIARASFRVGSECEDVDFNRAQGGEINAVGDGEVGAGRPGKVADVFAIETEGLCSIRVDEFAGWELRWLRRCSGEEA